MKILFVFGTRPEAIKMAPVIHELKRRSAESDLRSVVCVTAQHRQMLDQVLDLFNLVPDYDLDLMQDDQSPSQVTASAIPRLDTVLALEKPDWVLVQGDTTTTMVAALCSFYRRIKVGHVEAGLRTWNKFQPFPEEINRKIVDSICDLHFAPTETARRNLLQEGIDEKNIRVTGNTVIDALHWAAAMPFDWSTSTLGALPINSPDIRLLLVTAHRRENFGAPLESICAALREIAQRYRQGVHIVYPVHLNPSVQEPVYRLLRDISNISLLPPLDYLPLVHLMKRSYLVLTDSGGLQEEALGLGKPVLVLRELTERPEGVEAGTAKIVGTQTDTIVRETQHLLEDYVVYKSMSCVENPYGDGHAAMRIVGTILED